MTRDNNNFAFRLYPARHRRGLFFFIIFCRVVRSLLPAIIASLCGTEEVHEFTEGKKIHKKRFEIVSGVCQGKIRYTRTRERNFFFLFTALHSVSKVKLAWKRHRIFFFLSYTLVR